jgi:hypothetical protein
MGTGFQGRTFFKEHGNQGPIHFVSQVFPLNKLASPRQGHRLIVRNHFVENRLKNLTEPLASFLPIRQRSHGILHAKGQIDHHNLLYQELQAEAAETVTHPARSFGP